MTDPDQSFSDFKQKGKSVRSAGQLGLTDNMFGGAQVLRQRIVN